MPQYARPLRVRRDAASGDDEFLSVTLASADCRRLEPQKLHFVWRALAKPGIFLLSQPY
jgi:hypothetical protein